MQKISRFIIEHPKTFLSINILITLVFLFFTFQLKIDDDILNYLPDNDPTITTFNRLGDTFNGNNIGIIIIEADNIFNNEALNYIDSLTEKCQQVPGVTSVTSLTNVMDMRAVDGALNVERLVESEPQYSSEELIELKNYALSKDLYKDNLITADGNYSMMMLKFAPDVDTQQVVKKIRKIVADNDGNNYQHYFTGPSFVSDYADTSAKNDLRTFLPLVILLVTLVLFFTFRTLRGTLLPLLAVNISVIWTLGLIAATGRSLSTIGIAIPVILIAVGSAYGIHVMNEYYGTVDNEETKKEKLITGMGNIGMALFLSALTTIVGFVSLVTAELTPIKELGIFTAFGVLAAYLTAYTFIPSLLVLMKYKPQKQIKLTENGNNVFSKLASTIFANRTKILVIVGVVLVLSIILLPQIKFDTDYATAFRPNSEARIAINKVNEKFGGASIYHLDITGDLRSPFVLRQMKKIEDFMKENEVNSPISYADLIEEANKTINGVKEIPVTRNQVASLGLFLEGQEQVGDYLTPDYSEGIIIARNVDTSSSKLTVTNRKIREFLNTIPRKAYVVDLDEASMDLKNHCQEILKKDIATKIQTLTNDSSEEFEALVSDSLDNLMNFSQDKFAQEYSKDVRSFLTEELTEDWLGFSLENPEVSKAALLAIFQKGGNRDGIYEALAKLNPGCNEDDLEDAADYIAEDFFFLYLDKQNEKVDKIAEVLQQTTSSQCSLETISALLKNIFSDEIYLEDLPERFINSPAISEEEFNIELSGTPVVYETVTKKLGSSQLKSLGMSLILVFLLLVIQMGSWLQGIMICTPIFFTVIFNFAFMVVRKIPLDVATTMIASVAIGTGIDYSIHFANRFRRESMIQPDMENVLRITLGKVGKPISSNAISVALGFLVLVLSSTVTVARFGGLTALTMVVSALLAIFFLPALFSYLDTKKFKK